MDEIEVLQNIIKDYDTEIQDLDKTIQLYSDDIAILYKRRASLRNNKSIILDLVDFKLGTNTDRNLFDEE